MAADHPDGRGRLLGRDARHPAVRASPCAGDLRRRRVARGHPARVEIPDCAGQPRRLGPGAQGNHRTGRGVRAARRGRQPVRGNDALGDDRDAAWPVAGTGQRRPRPSARGRRSPASGAPRRARGGSGAVRLPRRDRSCARGRRGPGLDPGVRSHLVGAGRRGHRRARRRGGSGRGRDPHGRARRDCPHTSATSSLYALIAKASPAPTGERSPGSSARAISSAAPRTTPSRRACTRSKAQPVAEGGAQRAVPAPISRERWPPGSIGSCSEWAPVRPA